MNIKERILLKSKDEFLNNGIRNMTVQSLVVPLGISTKTFYKYFKNKEELLEEVLIQHYRNQFEIIRDILKVQNPVQIFLNIWNGAFQIENEVNNKFYYDIHYYYPELEKRAEARIGKDFWKVFQDQIRKGIDEGYFIHSILPNVIMESIAVLYDSVVRKDQFAKFGIPADQSFKNSVGVIIRGICTTKGLLEYDKFIAKTF